jgi:hypothetical protein
MQLNECPICHKNVKVKKLSCTHCQVDFEGDFYTSPLMALSADHQQFIELFILSSGSLKEMAQILGVSYPTVRSRLDQVIERLKGELKERDGFKNQILEKVALGEMTAEKAAEIIKNL